MRRLRFLDVVWCRFPERERPDAPGSKPRPVLVLGTAGDGSLIVAAYGTSQAHAAPKDWEVRYEAQRGTLTTFDLSRVVDVPATAAYFPSHLPALRKFPADRAAELIAANVAAQAETTRRSGGTK